MKDLFYVTSGTVVIKQEHKSTTSMLSTCIYRTWYQFMIFRFCYFYDGYHDTLSLLFVPPPLIWTKTGDFPGGPVLENLQSNAGEAGSIPGQGTKMLHASGLPSLHTTNREKLVCCNEDPVQPK